METQIVPSSAIPVRTLQEELQNVEDTKERKFLLYRIAGLSIGDSLTFVKRNMGSYNKWIMKPEFQAISRRRVELERSHRAEAIKLLRRENQIGAVIIEERIIEELMAELDNKEYNLIKTPIAKTVYDKLMQDIDTMPSIMVKKLSWVDKMEVLLGGRNENSETENSQSTQSVEGEFVQEIAQGNNEIQETEEGVIGEIIGEK